MPLRALGFEYGFVILEVPISNLGTIAHLPLLDQAQNACFAH